jgi:hypothetical protein
VSQVNTEKDPQAVNPIEKVRQTLKKHRERIMALKNVVGVGIGRETPSKERESQPCIVVYVKKKMPPSALDPGDCISHDLDGIPVRVEETGEFRAL